MAPSNFDDIIAILQHGAESDKCKCYGDCSVIKEIFCLFNF
jgi:hypothetical protein